MRMILAAVAMTAFGAAVGSPQAAEVASVPNHAPSILPAGKAFKLVWHDEFDGDSLDTSKWCYRTNFWGLKAHWFATPEDNSVEVKDGLMKMKLVKRPDGQYVSPQLQTGELVWDIPQKRHSCGIWFLPKREEPKFMHRYGYYECRCKLQQLPGWWSAFWMQAPMQGCSLDPGYAGIEQDIMESFEPGEVIPHWFHANGYGADYLGFCSPRRAKDVRIEDHNKTALAKLDKTVFHTFGLLWEPDGYTVYIDGVQHGEKVGAGPGEAISHTDEFILLTTEAKGYRKNCLTGTGVPELEATAAAGDAFEVDFVRVYDVVDGDDKEPLTLSYDDSGRASSSGDLLLPRVVDASTPVVLVIHGGGWNAMARRDLEGVATFFRDDLGFAAFNIDYRLASKDARWPACGDDCVQAARYLLSDRFGAATGIHPRKIWICGASAGGHLALWTAMSLPKECVAGVVAISPIGDPRPDFKMHPERYANLFGANAAERLSEMDPCRLAVSPGPPVLITHSRQDNVVPIESSRKFTEAYRRVGGTCDMYEYNSGDEPNTGGHAIWRRGVNPHKLLAHIESCISDFVRSHR